MSPARPRSSSPSDTHLSDDAYNSLLAFGGQLEVADAGAVRETRRNFLYAELPDGLILHGSTITQFA